MSVRSFTYRYSPRIARFLGTTYSPSIFDRYAYFPAFSRATNTTYAPSVSVRNTYAPANGRVFFRSFSPSYSDKLKYAPDTKVEYDNTFTPFYNRKLNYSPKINSSNDYNPFIFTDKRKVFAPIDYYDFERDTNFAPTDILITKPKIVIDNSVLRYLTEYNKFLVNLMEVL